MEGGASAGAAPALGSRRARAGRVGAAPCPCRGRVEAAPGPRRRPRRGCPRRGRARAPWPWPSRGCVAPRLAGSRPSRRAEAGGPRPRRAWPRPRRPRAAPAPGRAAPALGRGRVEHGTRHVGTRRTAPTRLLDGSDSARTCIFGMTARYQCLFMNKSEEHQVKRFLTYLPFSSVELVLITC